MGVGLAVGHRSPRSLPEEMLRELFDGCLAQSLGGFAELGEAFFVMALDVLDASGQVVGWVAVDADAFRPTTSPSSTAHAGRVASPARAPLHRRRSGPTTCGRCST